VIDVSRRSSAVPQAIGQEAAEAEILPAAAAPVAAAASPALKLPDKITVEKTGRKKIVIDPGHGGRDPGGKKLFGLKEKEMNLIVAKELYDLLKAEDMFEVLLTRSTDEFLPLAERSGIANSFKADIFISIHGNAHRNRKEKGFEIFFMSEKASDPGAAEVADYENSVLGLEGPQADADAASMLLHSMARNEYLNEGSRLAGLVAAEMEKRTPFANRGVKQAAFYVLRGTYAPGILVEMGFMTNSFDQKHLNDRKVHSKIASSIHKGVLKYAEMKGWK
jgi:N-acetylmuramoyl-L-alanine amidase